MARSDFEDKKEARIKRAEELASNNITKASILSKQSRDIVSVIPMGQPILVGHHSERGHRKLLDKSWNKLGQSVEASKKADYYADKAKSIENNTAISSDDPQAIEKLKTKLAHLEKSQEIMKKANKICRSKQFSESEKIKQLVEIGISLDNAKELLNPRFDYYNKGFQTFSLTNNNANIKRVRGRIKKLLNELNQDNSEAVMHGIRIVDDVQDNRLRLYFEGKPDEEVRKELKCNGFRWSPRFTCWQAYRSASYKLKCFLEWYGKRS